MRNYQLSTILNELISLTNFFRTTLEQNGNKVEEGHNFDWPNYVFESAKFRRAHLDVVDVSDTKKLYMVHLCIFPHRNDSSPIFGFDLIAGPNKVTGAFHDFSASFDNKHYMMQHFENSAKQLTWTKKRDLPEWAKNIFSDNMIAAGNIKDLQELSTLIEVAKTNLTYYLENVGSTIKPFIDSTEHQNYYCHNQRQNPHTPKVMEALGFDKDTVNRFISDCLFPSIK